MNLWKEAADIQTADMLKLPVPEAEYITIQTEPSEAQKKMVQGLAERAEKIRREKIDPSIDNMLKITSDGRINTGLHNGFFTGFRLLSIVWAFCLFSVFLFLICPPFWGGEIGKNKLCAFCRGAFLPDFKYILVCQSPQRPGARSLRQHTENGRRNQRTDKAYRFP